MVAVDDRKIALLRERLGQDADKVEFADMTELGATPAASSRRGTSSRAAQRLGQGDPRHRGADLGRAQPGGARRVPAPRGAAQPRVRRGRRTSGCCARTTRARCARRSSTRPAAATRSSATARRTSRATTTAAPTTRSRRSTRRCRARRAGAETLGFERATLAEVRRLVAEVSERAGLPPSRREDLVLAVNELATNSVRHGGGHGIVRVWRDEDALRCEVRDRGRIDDPLVGRRAASRRPDRRLGRVDRAPGLRPRAGPLRA